MAPIAPLPSSSSPSSSQIRPKRTPLLGPVGRLIVLLCFIVITLDRTKLLPSIQPIATTLYQWFILLSAFGIVLGVINVFTLHLRRIVHGQEEWGLSLVLVTTGLATLAAGLVQGGGVTGILVEWIFDTFLAPGAATLYALSFFFMAAALYRFLRITTPGGPWMVAGVFLMLFIQMPASANFLAPLWADTMAWLLTYPIMATFRGALLGSALAMLIIATRYLLGKGQE